MKLKQTITDSELTAKVYFEAEYSEYIVKFYKKGQYLDKADYFTDNLADAIGTARLEIDRMKRG